jgi:hypothetical protein
VAYNEQGLAMNWYLKIVRPVPRLKVVINVDVYFTKPGAVRPAETEAPKPAKSQGL